MAKTRKPEDKKGGKKKKGADKKARAERPESPAVTRVRRQSRDLDERRLSHD